MGIPTNSLNYIETIVARAVAKTENELIASGHLKNISYVDGLGRPLQSVAVKASPTGKDIVQPIAYDQFGRESVKYLPFAVDGNGSYQADATTLSEGVNSAYSFYTSPGKITTGRTKDTKPYAEIEYENSPLNRVLSQKGPGQVWEANNKKSLISYTTNSSTVQSWTAAGTAFNYEAGSLYVTETTDEDGKVVREFKDKLGRVVQKVAMDGSTQLRTAYVYDEFGRLRTVVPPLAAGPSDTELCYFYQYDERGRMIIKDLPGADTVFMVYDTYDRLVLSQDGNMRNNPGGGAWSFTHYDRFSRPILTGTVKIADAHSTLRANFKSHTGGHEAYDGSASCYGYTTNLSYPGAYAITKGDVLTVTYYDNYNFITDLALGADYGFSSHTFSSIYGSTAGSKTRGLATGGMTKVLEHDNYTPVDTELFAVTYYDDDGNPIRSITDNHLGGKDILATAYFLITFEVRQTMQRHIVGSTTTNLEQLFTYDHTGRLLETTEKLNSQPTIVSTALRYNELGELVNKYLHSKNNGTDFAQKIDHAYNIRGWLTDINQPDLSNDGDLFGMRLFYSDLSGLGGLSGTASYSGNIAATLWNAADDLTRGYSYTYDGLSRLKTASYADGAGLDKNVGAFDVAITNYDKNGNIRNLTRKYKGTLVDNLTYNYMNSNKSNQLLQVTDYGTHVTEAHDYLSRGGTYAYDKNGNMTRDAGKNSIVDYNLLNLPKNVSIGNEELSYVYTATGAKIAKVEETSAGTRATHYVGNIIYSDTEIDYILAAEGRLVKNKNNGKWFREYTLKDHLGNSRVSFVGSDKGGISRVTQVSSYYPFGLAFETRNINTNPGYDKNKYLYNGKELQNNVLDGISLDWLDYGARMYDASLGRWHVPDPLAEKYLSWSPYNYCYNSPIQFLDPNGMEVIESASGTTYTGADAQNWWKENKDSLENSQKKKEEEDKKDDGEEDKKNDGEGDNAANQGGYGWHPPMVLESASNRVTEASFLISAAGYHIGGQMEGRARFAPLKTLDGRVVANATSKYRYGLIPGKIAVGLGKGLRIGGGVLGTATTVYSGIQFIDDPNLENGANTTFGIIGFFGIPGMAVSGLYSGIKANVEYKMKNPNACQGGMGMYRWSCFVAGTKVTMSNYTYKNIEDITIGDSILTYNFKTKTIVVSRVNEMEEPVNDGLIQIEFSDGTKIINTEAHPYFTKDKGWCSYNPELSHIGFKLKASKLEEGNKCLVINDKKVRKLQIVKITELQGKEKTYNIIGISNNSNYFVHGILVHNESLVEEKPQKKE